MDGLIIIVVMILVSRQSYLHMVVLRLCLSVALLHACRYQGSPATLALHRRAHRGAFHE